MQILACTRVQLNVKHTNTATQTVFEFEFQSSGNSAQHAANFNNTNLLYDRFIGSHFLFCVNKWSDIVRYARLFFIKFVKCSELQARNTSNFYVESASTNLTRFSMVTNGGASMPMRSSCASKAIFINV